jgi:hypothetical protein
MIFYNWKKILKESNGKVGNILTILDILTYKKLPVNRKDRRFRFWQKSFHGDSFLLQPEALLVQRARYSDLEIAQYAGIASLRNYFEYQSRKNTTLDLMHYTGNEDIINQNRLLRIENERVHFKF